MTTVTPPYTTLFRSDRAVLAVVDLKPAEALARTRAVEAFRNRPQAEALAAANKRIANILRQAGERPAAPGAEPGPVPEEAALASALSATHERLETALVTGDFNAALLVLSSLRAPVDDFFDEVLVMAPDPGVKARRLALLSELRAAFLRVADIGELQETGAK